jgi:hypothetical protein
VVSLGIGGVALLIAGFAVNPGPPIHDNLVQLVRFGLAHKSDLQVGGWMQVTGTALIAVFALAVVYLPASTDSFLGALTVLGTSALVAVGLSELTAYKALSTGNPPSVRVAADVIPGVQYGYSIVAAPLIFFALSLVILRGRILADALGWAGLALGAVFLVCGLVNVITSIQAFINVLSGVQALWWLAAAALIGTSPARAQH